MKTILIPIFRNILILLLALLAIWYAFYRKISAAEMLATEATLGAIYFLLSCYEFMNAGFRSQLPAHRVVYFTDGLVTKHLLKLAIFAGTGAIMLIAGKYLRHVGYVCFLLAFTDLLVLLLKHRMRLYFIALEANYLLVGGDTTKKYFANEIANVEFRHNIVYFVKKDKTDLSVRVYVMKEKKAFVDQVLAWTSTNAVQMSAESRQLLETFKGF